MSKLSVAGTNTIFAHSNIFKGLFRSNDIVKYISDIPCDLIKTLESDVDQAQKFVKQLLAGETPSLIKEYPQQIPKDVVAAFKDVIGIFESLPNEIKDVADKADTAVSDVAKVFDDIVNGNIVDDLESVTSIVVSDFTSAWGDLTIGLEDGWGAATNLVGCIFNSCPHTTTNAYTCNGLYTTPTLTGAASAYPTKTKLERKTAFQLNNSTSNSTRTAAPAQPPIITPGSTQTQRSTVSTRFPQPSASVKTGSGGMHMTDAPRVFQLCWFLAVGVLGFALLL